jgi:ABC-2 type transport system permease protein
MAILDQGYEHWHGTLHGRGWRWLIIARHGVRIGMRNWLLRLLIIAAWLPSLLLAAVICLWGMVEDPNSPIARFLAGFEPLRGLVADPKANRTTAWTLSFHLFIIAEMYIAMFLVLFVGPGLISRDLRFNALPLYFSRPIRRLDYFVGKLGTIGWFLCLVTVVPAAVAWVFGVLVSREWSVIADTFRLLFALVAYGVVVTVSAGLLMLAMSSLTRKSAVVVIMWAGFWMATTAVSGLLQKINRDQIARAHYQQSTQLQELQKQAFDLENRLHHLHGPVNPKEPPKPFDRAEAERLAFELTQVRIKQYAVAEEEASRFSADYTERQKSDWRPLVSYTGNLLRIGDALLGAHEAWQKVDEVQNNHNREMEAQGRGRWGRRDAADVMAPPYPCYWSVAVLVALGVVSIWILNRRVTSLDRLR